MAPYIFGAKKGVHMIDLVKSQKMLASALEFITKFSQEGKTILMIGTKMQVKAPLKQMALETGMPYTTEKWLGGTITNFMVIKRLIKKYQDLLGDKQTGKFEKYTKKEQLDFDREIKKLDLRVGGLVSLKKLPDAMFVWDIKHEKTAVTEARKKNIPVIAICDTNVNPADINYIIPCNDDATKAIKLVMGCVKEAVLEGKKKIKQ